MPENIDYSQLALEELLTEEKKIKKNEIYSALIIGICLGIIVFGLVKNGFGFLYIFLSSGIIYLVYRNSQSQKQNLKQIQTEIANKNKA